MRTVSTLILLLCLLSPVAAKEPTVDGGAVLEEVWRLARNLFLDPAMNGVDWDAARSRYDEKAARAETPGELAAVINGMLGELGTSHTVYYAPDQVEFHHLRDILWRAFRRPGRGGDPEGFHTYTGIGIFTRVIDGRRFVTGVIEGTPAHTAGLLAGDEIISAGGGPFEPVGSFMGREGQKVLLEIRRTPEEESLVEIEVVPRFLAPRTMFEDAIEESARIIERNGVKVGYVRVWSYAGLRNQRRLLDTLQEEPLCGADVLVWDIRGGWGGASPSYLNLFNRDVPVMTMVGRNGVRRDIDAQWRKPAVLLIDGNTRSGKEIIAYGFKKHGIGPLVGTKTAGAVLFGKPILLSNGAMLYLAVADVLVDGVRLEGNGVEPDISVPFDVRYAAGDDPQLEKAVEVAAGLTAATPARGCSSSRRSP